ncbi:ABC transporter ATP-binding protein [Paradevosia shaoguanensis]|uniref:Sn-glycerol-3-phosphate ABC transporter ATP-binding protein UgpC n=1 Tax=Paradevosia shaoguanensis TaxID=1335043 RepID=A0AA41QMA4_9HYPH|nr:sn-glycerol-3-phosphate ABC transporter ATP-binding protein UgpC [Paradevosia shaoguanensis]MCF1741961.1 sn-glycerol-3-phosphate ABC transporter ATP-binding protein UgpC [Paradevosia shaoguanensis]MCI0126444.1 sn-glycerol-3-phosphate ABC transporter ATP-binding protein UgpC [Paradevosia shaoguanensis]
MASVQIQDVRKSYGQLQTIKGVSVEVPDGAFVVLVGPSGCGKSTLLRMIAGLEEISGGTIRIGGKVINDVEPKNRDIAMVFQNYALYPHMTIAENMAFSLKLAKRSKAEIETRVTEAARILGLSDYLERFPKQLSGGQRQRVAMGRAIVRNPQVFLFDEPLSNLDAKLRVQMRTELKELHARLKTTTIYVTHDQIEAMTMADRIVVMRDGIVEQVGAPLDLYDRPVNTFVASFIGSPSMNFIAGTITDDRAAITTANGDRLPLVQGIEARGPVSFGIRPEHLFVTGEGKGFEIEVTAVEPTGSETYVQGVLGDQKISALLRERVAVQVGQKLRLDMAPANVHLFDSASGQRLG